MVNQYGIKLDRNGYAPSLFKNRPGRCLLCERVDRPLQRHEVFHGPNRQKAKALGCWVLICDECHRMAHSDAAIDRNLKKAMQTKLVEVYGWTTAQFRAAFGKNYLGGDE